MIPRFFPYVPPAILGGLALYVAVLAWRGRRSGRQQAACAEAWTEADEERYRLACAVEGGRP